MTEPIRTTANRLLSVDVRKEFLIASVETENHRRVRFRLNPGHTFERMGHIARYPSGELRVTVSQQYRPHDEMTWLADRSLGADITAELRELTTYATWWESGPHWRETYHVQMPPWSCVLPVTSSDAVLEAQRQVTVKARTSGVAHFLWRSPDGLAGANNPPSSMVIFSVNRFGEWSLHDGRATLPLDMPPDAAILARGRRNALALARQDLGTRADATVRSGKSAGDWRGVQPATPRPPDRPARRR